MKPEASTVRQQRLVLKAEIHITKSFEGLFFKNVGVLSGRFSEALVG
jgi:hypothetical protein